MRTFIVFDPSITPVEIIHDTDIRDEALGVARGHANARGREIRIGQQIGQRTPVAERQISATIAGECLSVWPDERPAAASPTPKPAKSGPKRGSPRKVKRAKSG